MTAPNSLAEIYLHELQDLWSANDQMIGVVTDLADAAQDPDLTQRLIRSVDGIKTHTKEIKALIEAAGGDCETEFCKGMEGLVKEARKHAIDADFDDADARDVVIVAQFQRMCHYGICGFGTAKAFAEALGKEEWARKLDNMTANVYRTDENMTDLAERSVNLQAKAKTPELA